MVVWDKIPKNRRLLWRGFAGDVPMAFVVQLPCQWWFGWGRFAAWGVGDDRTVLSGLGPDFGF
jgi:hypothetical protein